MRRVSSTPELRKSLQFGFNAGIKEPCLFDSGIGSSKPLKLAQTLGPCHTNHHADRAVWKEGGLQMKHQLTMQKQHTHSHDHSHDPPEESPENANDSPGGAPSSSQSVASRQPTRVKMQKQQASSQDHSHHPPEEVPENADELPAGAPCSSTSTGSRHPTRDIIRSALEKRRTSSSAGSSASNQQQQQPALADNLTGLHEAFDTVAGIISLHNSLKSAGMKTKELRELCHNEVLLDAPLSIAIERIAQAADKIKQVKKMLMGKISLEAEPTREVEARASIQGDASSQKHEVDLSLMHPSIANFQVLMQDERIHHVMPEKKELSKLEHAVMVNPKDDAAAQRLRSFIQRLQTAYSEVIAQRLAKVGLFKECINVIRAGTEGFAEVYNSVWNLISRSERESFPMYQQAVKDVRQPMINTRAEQLSADIVELYQHAALIKPKYDQLLQDLQTTCMVNYGFSVELQLPSQLKKSSRIVEKAAVRHTYPGDASNVCDIVRGMLTVCKMLHVTYILQELSSNQSIAFVRIKERFLEAPSGGGWRDLMVNFYFRDDPHRHVCEVQLAHELMVTARKGLPGHVIYGHTRNAMELLEKRMGDVSNDVVALANFWHESGRSKLLDSSDGVEARSSSSSGSSGSYSDSGRKGKSGHDKNSKNEGCWLTDAPLSEWRGVTTSRTSGRVVGLDLRSMELKGKVPEHLSHLKCLEFLDLRDNPSLLKPPGVPLDLAGQMHYSDFQGVQAFCDHITKTEEEQLEIAEGERFVRKYGPDGHVLKTLYDKAHGHHWFKTKKGCFFDNFSNHWFEGHDVTKWQGVTCDQHKRVKALNLFGTGIKNDLPEAIGDFPQLEELSLKWCVGLTTLPESIAKLESLRTIDLSWCQGLQELPNGICFLIKLRKLYLRGCSELLQMPLRLGALRALEELDLSWCPKLTSLPEGLDGLRELQTLGLRGCQGLSILPSGLGVLLNLRSLYLTDCLGTVLESEPVERLSGRGCKIFLKS